MRLARRAIPSPPAEDRKTTETDLIERFYAAFARRDGEVMASCYAPDVRFSEPVFPTLEGEHAGAMWKMLCGR